MEEVVDRLPICVMKLENKLYQSYILFNVLLMFIVNL